MLIEVNGTRLHYEKRGKGRPLILVHGNGEDHTIFQQALLLLEKRFCCYAVDSRCHGQSRGGALHYSEMAEDMLCFMEQLDLLIREYEFTEYFGINILLLLHCHNYKIPYVLRKSVLYKNLRSQLGASAPAHLTVVHLKYCPLVIKPVSLMYLKSSFTASA